MTANEQAVLKSIAKDVAYRYKEVVGIGIDQIEFHQNMDASFYDESLKKIYKFIDKKFPGIDVVSGKASSEFKNMLDEELFKRMMSDWAYMF